MNEKLKIHLPEDQIDKNVKKIAKQMANSSVFNNIRLIPDCHMGSGCCVGMTDILTNKVIPQIVGGDIGCGRIMSRRDARTTFTMKQYKEEMKNVFSTYVVKDTLDEIPNAYKDSKQIQDLIIPSVEIIKQLKPILNVKGF